MAGKEEWRRSSGWKCLLQGVTATATADGEVFSGIERLLRVLVITRGDWRSSSELTRFWEVERWTL